jgi:hypothetical protein
MGHVRDLPKKTLGVDEKSFKPTYVALPEKKKTLTESGRPRRRPGRSFSQPTRIARARPSAGI